jgi:MYXO-CTERM domain-containing protein
MKTIICLFGLVGLMAGTASAATIAYTTSGSTLSCNGIAGCVPDGLSGVTLDGTLTIVYNPGSASNVKTPSNINLGNLVTSGSGNDIDLTGLKLTINILSTPPGTSGSLPNGSVSGTISVDQSLASITFSPSNTTTSFGTLPGVNIGGIIYQVKQTTLDIEDPTDGSPVGETSIQGAVSAVPEPSTLLPALALGLIGLWRRRATQ